MKIGCQCKQDAGAVFTLWAPNLSHVDLKIMGKTPQRIAMHPLEKGYWQTDVSDIQDETKYSFILPGDIERPDPASHYQPEGVHGPSQVVEHHRFHWEDKAWSGIPLVKMVIYEMHVGTFTQEGTFEAIMNRLDELVTLGINTIELMPIAAFPGKRNWGYDGVGLFAVQESYGGPQGLKRLVNACHQKGIAVLLDVVYNHLGPEGNYLREFGSYFTDKYKTPWGEALNFDDAASDEVRNFFIENVLHWLDTYHIDGLRLDAVHAITDMSAQPFLSELANQVTLYSQQDGRPRTVIAESDLNDARLLRPAEQNGYGLHASWCDDFHHSLHTVLTGETKGYYHDFGTIEHLVKTLKNGFVYDGTYSACRKRTHGNHCDDLALEQFVVSIQNHDQIGNRLLGERLTTLVDFSSLKLAALTTLFSPSIPMLFMGEEYGETAPFHYFIDHTDQQLVEAVRQGRGEEFKAFNWQGEVPDPAGETVYKQSVLNWNLKKTGPNEKLWRFYQRLITLRKTLPALQMPQRDRMAVTADKDHAVIFTRRWFNQAEVLIISNFGTEAFTLEQFIQEGIWEKVLATEDREWGGQGSVQVNWQPKKETLVLPPRSALVWQRTREQ